MKEMDGVDYMRTRELALVSIFSALWIAAQFTLGPILGRFSIGPVSLHGVVNRVVGWMLMLVLADISGMFGRVSVMAVIASLATRLIRLSPLTGILVGIGYSLGGIIFDVIFFRVSSRMGGVRSRTIVLLVASIISGTLAMGPYIFFKFLILSRDAFLVLSPVYAVSIIKGTIFSVIGTILGLSMRARVKKYFTHLRH